MISDPVRPTMPLPHVVASHVSKHFGGVQALDDVSISLGRGEIRSLVGENGCGKSTLIKILAGVHQADAGQITINGRTFRSLRPIDAIHEGIQVIYQDFSLFPNLTVAENIALSTQLERGRLLVNGAQSRRIATQAIDRMGLHIDLARPVSELSVADKQLVSIARALVHEARLVIMDEPTTALTQREVDDLFGIVKALQKEGISVLFVSHKLKEVLAISEEITVLRNGRKVAEGSTCQFDHGRLVRCMTGRELTQRCRVPAHAPVQTPALRIEGLGRKDAFEDVGLDLHRGEIVGVTGLLGSGRTELALSLFGVEAMDTGTVLIDGRPTRLRSVHDAMAHGIAYVPEDRLTEGLFMERSTEKNLVATSLRGLLNRIRLLDRDRMRAQASRWIDQLGIKTPSAATPVQHLSGGNQQKVVLARWLAGQPRILVLNGPTVGVDVGAKTDIHAQMRALAGQGVGILVFSDDLPELVQTCDRILLMHRGRIIEQFQGDDCNEERLLRRLSELR